MSEGVTEFMGNWLHKQSWQKLVLALSLFAFAFSLYLALLPKSPREPFELPLLIRKLVSEVGSKYWIVLALGGLIAIWRDRKLFLPLVLNLLLTQVAIEIFKLAVGEMRPDGRFFNSFPSGHTTSSFAYATFMNFHFRWGWLWYPFATLVGIVRILSNAHWWHDVVGGAALGHLLATIFCQWWHKRMSNLLRV